MKKSIVLCADDYGQALPISEGIIRLIENGRLSAVSCMANQENWQAHAVWLKPFVERVDVGLHFNLTEGEALSPLYRATYGSAFYSLPNVIRRAVFRQFDREVLAAELNAQINRFTEVMGVPPHFIDGHQHVHQFPLIRDVLLKAYSERFRGETKPYLRLVYHANLLGQSALKKFVIQALGAGDFKRALIANHIPHNTSFSGMYDFAKPVEDYSGLFKRFMSEVSDQGLIMCHPALKPRDDGLPSSLDAFSASGKDPIAASRQAEFAYLASPQFPLDCEAVGVTLSRFKAR